MKRVEILLVARLNETRKSLKQVLGINCLYSFIFIFNFNAEQHHSHKRHGVMEQ